MNSQGLLKLLESVQAGKLAPAKAIERLKHLPFEDLDFAKIDHHRTLRQGFAEVIFGKGKTAEQIAAIVRAMLAKKDSKHNILITRAEAKIFAAVKRAAGKNLPVAKLGPVFRLGTLERRPTTLGKASMLVVSTVSMVIPVCARWLL